jgi:hypothetical protein
MDHPVRLVVCQTQEDCTMPETHDIKCLAVFFDAATRGEKTFEVRKDDRAYQCGDTVNLARWTREELERDNIPGFPPAPFAPRAVASFRVGFVLRGGQFGLEPGYVAFSLLPLEEVE